MKYFNLSLLSCLLLSAVLITSCGDDEPITSTGDAPVSSFQFEIDSDNFLTVNFMNFSQDADSQEWDFGDGEKSTERDPSHTYQEAGTYTVRLTSTNASGTHTFPQDVMIVDPNAEINKITGGGSKVWKLSRNVDEEEFPAQVGPADKSQIWWALGREASIGSRPCLMEEEYIFGSDGSYTYNTDGTVWGEEGIWAEDFAASCVDETDPAQMTGANGQDLSAWGSGNFTFDYDSGSGTLTVNGLGAHIGVAKAGTNAEVDAPQNSVTYRVTMLDVEGSVDKMVLETSIDGGYWQMFLVSYDDPADEPDLPGATPVASFTHEIDGSTVTLTNTSMNADSYRWDFGDGEMSMDENPVHTYASDGPYTITLTAMNANGESNSMANIVISTSSVFTAESVHGGSSKVWKLNPIAGALAVGPSKGSGEWWANSIEDVDGRSCTFDDTYTFGSDGSFEYNTNGDLWAEAYMGVDPAGCVAEDMLSADAAAWGSGSHTFSIMEGSDPDPSFISVTGTGAFIALPKAFNGGEYAAGPPTTDGTVRYEVLSYVSDGTNDFMVITVDISENEGGGAYWTFSLISE